MLKNLLIDLESLRDLNKSKILQRFFKTGAGEYGEGDIFWGICVPDLRNISKKYYTLLSFGEIEKLINSQIHEQRFVGFAIIRLKYEKSKNLLEKEKLINFSLQNINCINNWDLVDTFIPYVFGEYYFSKDKLILYEFANSQNLWKRRISIITTFYFVKQNEFEDVIKICEILLDDKHDLIHKATGWMLREMGKKDINSLYNFLDKYHKIMPRTMLRYSIEKLENDKKYYYMGK